MATDFCSSHSFDRAPAIPRGTNSSTTTSSSMNTPAAAVDRMTEEEQLQAAIRASMNEASGMNVGDDDDDASENDEYIMPPDSDDDDDVKIASGVNDEDMDTREDDEGVGLEAAKEVTFHDEILAIDVGEEPTGTKGVARIMIRMPDGKRLVRKFKLEDTVKIIYAFVSVSRRIFFILETSLFEILTN